MRMEMWSVVPPSYHCERNNLQREHEKRLKPQPRPYCPILESLKVSSLAKMDRLKMHRAMCSGRSPRATLQILLACPSTPTARFWTRTETLLAEPKFFHRK